MILTTRTPESLRRSLLRGFLASGALVLLISVVSILWAANANHTREQTAYYAGLTEMIGELVRPSVEMSDYSETQRLLGLVAERQGILPAVLTHDGDLLLSDYTKRSIFDPLKPDGMTPAPGCQTIQGRSVQDSSGISYDVFCTELVDHRALGIQNSELGFAIALHRKADARFPFWLAAVLFGVVASSILLTTVFLRRRIHRMLVLPIERIATNMERQAQSPLTQELPSSENNEVQELHRLGKAFEHLLQSFREENQKSQQMEKKAATHEVANEVEHNIRSPLEALEIELSKLTGVPDRQISILRGSSREIRVIADRLRAQVLNLRTELDPEFKPVTVRSKEKSSIQLLSNLVESAVAGKQVQLQAKRPEIELYFEAAPDTQSLFVSVQPIELRSILSNLINNAVEATPRSGQVAVQLENESGALKITIRDSGTGISPEILPKLCQKGATFDKKDGSGVGLYHAKSVVESWGGSLAIESQIGHGTAVSLRIPAAPTPDWFVNSIETKPSTEVIVLDDDLSIHAAWKEILGEAHALHCFERGADFLHWAKEEQGEAPRLYLIDYQLQGESKTGLDLIGELNIGESTILVTHQSDDPAIISRARWLGAKVMPKSFIRSVTITVSGQAPMNDYNRTPKVTV